jgi:predicted PurR-regulated permease PerM
VTETGADERSVPSEEPSVPSEGKPAAGGDVAAGRGLPRALLVLLGLGATTLVVAGMQAASGIIAPTMLGVILVVTVAPARGWIMRWGAPAWTAGIATILLVYAILAGMIIAMVVSGAQLAEIIPQYSDEFNKLVSGIGDWLSSLGIQQSQLDAFKSSLDPSKLVGLLADVASSALSILSLIAFVAVLVVFIGFDSGKFPSQLSAANDERPAVIGALVHFAKSTRTYMTVSAVFGLIVAVIDTIALYLLGVPGAVVWGVLSFVTNFIPNIGFVIGVIPPAILGLLEGGPTLMIWVIVVYSVINFVIQSIIQPKFQGDALGLSTTLTFLSLIFWAWVLGPIGAILALPMTILAKALLVDADPRSRWLSPMLSGAALVEAPRVAAAPAED